MDLKIVDPRQECTHCSSILPLKHFSGKKEGCYTKTCSTCRTIKRYQRRKKWWNIMINSSKLSDAKREFVWDKADYIDKDHLIYQREDQNNRCYYCNIWMCIPTHADYVSSKMTIERMNNTQPHIKENIVLSCNQCNCQRGDRYSFNEFYDLKQQQRLINTL